MDWTNQHWARLLPAIAKGRGVVPVVGADLLVVRDGERDVPMPRLLAERLRERLAPADRERVPARPTLHELAALPTFRGTTSRFVDSLQEIQEVELARAEDQIFPERAGEPAPGVDERHPLRLLAEITDFGLYVCTTPDGLLQRVLARSRALADDDVRGFMLLRERPGHPVGPDRRVDVPWDLPPGWEPRGGQPPFLFHLFGRLADGRFDFTEEDHLEMLCRLQAESYQPEQLCRELRPSHILILGHPLTDWASRFFVRMLRGERLSAPEITAMEALADGALVPGPPPPYYEPLISFLDSFSESTRVYREGSPAAFVRELYRRWQSARATRAAVAAPPAVVRAQADLDNDGVFVSYCHEDAPAALRFAEALRAAGVKVYLDVSKARDAAQPGLEHGSDYERKLRENVERATFFVPLLSRSAQSRGGWFRREWFWAGIKSQEYFGIADRSYIRPVVVDDTQAGRLDELPRELTSTHMVALREGVPTAAFITELQAALARWARPRLTP